MNLFLEDWMIEFNSGIPVYKQVVNRIEAAIAEGKLKEGVQLPTIRSLHQKLQINPNTVAKAYRELELKGIIDSQRGSGCFVAPPSERVKFSVKEKKTKMRELCLRMTAEARGYGIQIEELIKHINQGKSYA